MTPYLRVVVGSFALTFAAGLVAAAMLIAPLFDWSSNTQSGHAKSMPSEFEMTAHNGNLVSNATLAGKPYVAFFGFTNCPDICPTTLFELTDLMKELGEDAEKLNAIMISVDPERDTPELLSLYMTVFDSRILALRGTTEQTVKTIGAFKAYARKVPTDGAGYTFEHTAGIYLIDQNGRFLSMLDMHEPRDIRLQKLRNLVAA